jgi:uncharacterized Rmd1/YagE family protein
MSNEKNKINFTRKKFRVRNTKFPASTTTKHRETKSLIDSASFSVSAVIAFERIDIRSLSHLEAIAQSPLMIRLPEGGIAAIFRYGAIAYFAATEKEKKWAIRQIEEVSSGLGDPLTEEAAIVIIDTGDDEGPYGTDIRIKVADRERLQLMAEAMSKAALLSFQERRAAHDFDRIEPLAQDLADDGKFSVKSKELSKAVGSMLLSGHRLTGRAEVMDKPDLLWDNPHLAGLYAKLEGDYELQERAIAIDRKLATLSHTAETLVANMRYQSSHNVEVLIFLLISVELCLAFYGHLFH